MKTKSKGVIRSVGTLAVIFLIFTMGLSPVFAKERKHGKELSIQKKDGVIIRGELIAVKNNSLLLNSGSSPENSIDIGDVSAITIVNKSQFLTGAGIGLLTGAILGAGVGYAPAKAGRFGWLTSDAAVKTAKSAAIFGVIFGTLGGILGVLDGIDRTIKIKETGDPNEINVLLGKLRDLARYPDEK